MVKVDLHEIIKKLCRIRGGPDGTVGNGENREEGLLTKLNAIIKRHGHTHLPFSNSSKTRRLTRVSTYKKIYLSNRFLQLTQNADMSHQLLLLSKCKFFCERLLTL